MAKVGISVRLPEQLERDVRVAAAKMDLNRSQAIVEALENWLTLQRIPQCPVCDEHVAILGDRGFWCRRCDCSIVPVANGEES